MTRILAVRALRVATLRAATPASHPAPGCCGGHLPTTRNALTLSNTEGSEHVAVCTDGCETRRGHHHDGCESGRHQRFVGAAPDEPIPSLPVEGYRLAFQPPADQLRQQTPRLWPVRRQRGGFSEQ